MSNNALCGENGDVLVGTHTVAEIGNWSLALSRSTTDVPVFSTSREKTICGPYDWSGSFSGSWYMDDTAGQKALYDALTGGTTVTLHLSIDGTDEYTGSAYITAINVETPHDGIISVSFDYEGTGSLTQTLS